MRAMAPASATSSKPMSDAAVIVRRDGGATLVITPAWDAARARDVDVLLADTAGRLQNQQGLMDDIGR